MPDQMAAVTDDEWAALGFVAAVRESFGFLADHGFREVRASTFVVEFDSDSVRMRIDQDPRSYEINASFSRNSHAETPRSGYSYGLYLRLVDPAAAADYYDFAATTPGAVSRGVAKLAADVRAATPLLTGDDATYDELARLGTLVGQERAAQSRRSEYGGAGEAAWQAKDWPAIVAVYSRHEADLTDAERRRLDLARHRLDTGGPPDTP
jgi:hypothetical protein